MPNSRPYFLSVCIAAGTALLSGCKLALLEPKGSIALAEKQIFLTAVLLMLLVVIPVIFLTLLFAWRYRAGNSTAKYAPNWSHNTWIEVVCWSVPLAIIATLGVITWESCHRLDPYKPLASSEQTLTIQVISLQWKWLFIYPDQHIASINYVQFPVNKPVRFLITAEGPMNSFQIPQLGSQIYAMAGMQSKLHLIANEIGDFTGIATNFTGDGFSEMTFKAHASTEADFNQWVNTVKTSTASKLTLAEYEILLKPSIKDSVKYFTLDDEPIFALSMMKSMMPNPKKCNVTDKKATRDA